MRFQNEMHISGTEVLPSSVIREKGVVSLAGKLVSDFWHPGFVRELLHGRGTLILKA